MEEAKTEKEREEARRQLKRLREEEQQLLADADELKQKMEKEQNQSRFAEERKQLEQTRNDAQQAAESMQRGESSRALAEANHPEWKVSVLRLERASGPYTCCLARRDEDGIPQTVAVAVDAQTSWDAEPAIVFPSAE